ncbi:MAG: hypothetical protein ACREL6_03565 [Gemmatimonadales bacterium]
MTGHPFDHERDEALGGLLREHYEAPGHEAFVNRVIALAGKRPSDSAMEILAGWIRPGIAAAIVLLLSALVWSVLQPEPAEVVTLGEVVRPGGAPAGLFADDRPDGDVILVSVLGEP